MLSLVASAVGCTSSDKANTPVATLVSIDVAPATPSVAVGSTQQFVATGKFSDNSTKDLSTTANWTSAAQATATISATGLASGVAMGSTLITATSAGKSGSATLTVTKAGPSTATLVSIAVTPANKTIAKDGTQQFIATGSYSDNSTMDLSATAAWTSSSTATATISGTGLATGVANGTTMISAASGSVSGNTTLTVSAPPTLVSIAVTTTSASIAKGTTTQLTATGTYSDGMTKDLSATATWTSGTTANATVSAAGLVTGVLGGTSVITATSDGKSGAVTITVTGATLVSIAVTPGAPSIAAGTTQPFTATGTFMEGTVATTQNLTAVVTWASATPATATITAAGLATAKVMGTTVVSATSGAIVGMTTLTVTPALLTSIEVTTTTPSIAKGQTAKFIATGKFGDNTTQDLTTQVMWTSGTAGTATISTTAPTIGVATSVAKGTSVISAKLGTVTGMLTLTVTDAQLVSIAVTAQVLPVSTAATPSVAKNTKVQLIATGTYTDGMPADITDLVTWAASGNTVTVSNAADSKGIASAGNTPTTSMITATIGPAATAIIGKLTLTVTPATLLSINVTPATHTIAAGTFLQFQAMGFFTDASQQDMTETAAWSSATGAVATISSVAGTKGLAKGIAPLANGPGTSEITAAVGAINNKATLTVSKAVLVSISIDPPAPTLALGTTVTFSASGLYTDGSKQTLTTTVVWSSSKEQFAKISNAAGTNGKVTLVAKGTTDITATATIAANQTVTATTTLIVTDPALTSIEVGPKTTQPSPLTIEKGTTLQFAAVGTYTDGSTQDLTNTVTWKSDKTLVATISNTAGSLGLATATGVGAASISATSSAATGSIVGSKTLAVNDGKLLSIAVTPATPSIAFGTKIQLVAKGTYNDGAQQDITGDVTWTSDSVAAAVDVRGLAAAGLAAGSAKITATQVVGAVTISGNTTLTVTAATLQAVAITPQPTASIAKGTTVQFTATGSFSDNTKQDLTDTATWNSSDATVASVSNDPVSNGLASGAKVGPTNVTASILIGGNTITSPAVALTVTAATLVSIAITPNPASVALGDTLDLTATGTYTDGTTQVLTGGAVTWGTMTMATASVSNQAGQRGRVTGGALGMVDITATSSVATGSKVGTINVKVTAPIIKSIAVTPAAPANLVKTHTQQFVAQATLTDNTKKDISATATWISATTMVASISSTGLATGIVAGTSKITAASDGVTSPNVTLTVTN